MGQQCILMIKSGMQLALILVVIQYSMQQAKMIWDVPDSGFQSNNVAVISSYGLTLSPKRTNITFNLPFTGSPTMALSLAAVSSITKGVALVQEADSVTATYFVHKLSITDLALCITVLKVRYAAIDLNKFNFVYPFTMQFVPPHLSTSNSPNYQYVQIQYLSPLNSSRTYSIVAMIAGLSVSTTTGVHLSISALLYTISSFLLKLTIDGGMLKNLQFTRFVIDRTQSQSHLYGIGQLQIMESRIQHSPSGSTYNPARVDFALAAEFYGISQFTKKFECLTNMSVNNAGSLSDSIVTNLLVFMQLFCPPGFPMYQPLSLTCYVTCSPRLYTINATICGLCYSSCYDCTGPTNAQCLLYLPMESISPQGNPMCKPNYAVQNISGHCLDCQAYVAGCESCHNTGQCIICEPNCTLSNGSCNCTVICGLPNQYINPATGICDCLPQYYLEGGQCKSCYGGCYICIDDAYNCLACIDGYEFVMNSCVKFQNSLYLIDNTMGTIGSDSRCLQYITDSCLNYCHNQSYFYQLQCYLYQCPSGSFPIRDSLGNRICQSCPFPCIECDIYAVCKKCMSGPYYLTTKGICLFCTPMCLVCLNQTACAECATEYELLSNHTCKQNMPTPATSCLPGCQICLIDTYCELCLPNYFRRGQSSQCSACTGPGVTLSNYTLLSQTVIQVCMDICGDGIIVFDQCDDGNSEKGDGCSEICKVEESYTCESQQDGPSICFQEGYTLQCQFSKYLKQNKVNITLHGEKILISAATLEYQCDVEMQLIQIFKQGQNLTYSFAFGESVEGTLCSFKAYYPSFTISKFCNITSYPPAYYYTYSNPVLNFIQKVMNYTAKPIAYIVWGLCLIGIDPYDILNNNVFIFAYLASLYQFQHQPSNVYILFDQLRYFSFDYQSHQYELKKYGKHYIDPSWKLLCFMAAVLLFHQGIARILKSLSILPRTITRLFQSIFHNRFILYICVYVSFEPVIILYSTALLSITPISLQSILIPSIHLAISVTTFLLLVISLGQIMRVKSHTKYIYSTLLVKGIVIFMPYIVFLQTDYLFITSSSALVSMIFFIIITSLDTSYEHAKTSETFSNASTSTVENEIENQKLSRAKGICRKINIYWQFSCFALISLLRLICIGYNKTYSSAQTFGILINIIFVFGNLIVGNIMNIISQSLTIALFISKQNINQNETKSENSIRLQQQSRRKVLSENGNSYNKNIRYD